MSEFHTLLSGLAFGESPRWHDDRLWFSDFDAREVSTVDLEGKKEVIARVAGAPMGLGFLPDGRLLIVSMRDGLLLCQEHDGRLVTHAELRWTVEATPTSVTSASTFQVVSLLPEAWFWSRPMARSGR